MKAFMTEVHVIYSLAYIISGINLLLGEATLDEVIFRMMWMELWVIVYMILTLFSPFKSYLYKIDEKSAIHWDFSICGMMLIPIAQFRLGIYESVILMSSSVIIWLMSCGYPLYKYYKNYKLTFKN